ncbi:MAG: YraN family protein [Acidobacteria bacterium]|nr:YraN family protein [Acidobacteriota bacterium]MBS1866013.1 YraN family protein [Acidobacteriota bacterium]
MPVFSALAYRLVRWKSRRGLRDESEAVEDSNRTRKQRTGVRGETLAYWYLRKQGYVFVARNYTPRGGAKGEVDLIGYDGETLVFVEVRTRTVGAQLTALPELSVTAQKQHVVARTARRFLAERHVKDTPLRFDVLAIDNIPGSSPEVRLHKDAFSPHV